MGVMRRVQRTQHFRASLQRRVECRAKRGTFHQDRCEASCHTVVPLLLNLPTLPAPDPRVSIHGPRRSRRLSYFGIPSSRATGFRLRNRADRLRGVDKPFVLARFCSLLLPGCRRTTRSVISSPGEPEPAKSSTVPSSENNALVAAPPETVFAAAVSRSISNSSSCALRHSVTPSEYATSMSPASSEILPFSKVAALTAPSIGPPTSRRCTTSSPRSTSGAGKPALL